NRIGGAHGHRIRTTAVVYAVYVVSAREGISVAGAAVVLQPQPIKQLDDGVDAILLELKSTGTQAVKARLIELGQIAGRKTIRCRLGTAGASGAQPGMRSHLPCSACAPVAIGRQ